jgi:hypothetical protein
MAIFDGSFSQAIRMIRGSTLVTQVELPEASETRTGHHGNLFTMNLLLIDI